MTCVVLGGSRHISKLGDDVRARLDRIVAQGFRVVVGDANGADKALQKYFADRAYQHVEVFCSGETPRNNVGGWVCRRVVTQARPGTFQFYAAKDQAMAKDASVGLMIWDGKSAGTVLNVWRLMRQGKASAVYVQPQRRFQDVRSQEDWRALLDLAPAEARADIEKKLKGESPPEPTKELPQFSLDLPALGEPGRDR